MAKKTVGKEVKVEKGIWAVLWAEYKAEWKKLWNEYKSLIIPFITGTAKYIWQLVYGLLALVIKGLYETGKVLVEKLIDLIIKA